MKYAAFIVVLPLLGCGAITKATETPVDPAAPDGPTQAEAVVAGASQIVGTVSPLAGALIAAVGASVIGTLATKKKA